MNRKNFWRRVVFWIGTASAAAVFLWLGITAWQYVTWRNKMIEWDFGTIERLCGGDTEEERLLEIRFIKEWEYKALKRTRDGKTAWIHWQLSKRDCGNWTVTKKPEGLVIRRFDVRFPNGAPPRDSFSCLGDPVDENEYFRRRDDVLEALRQASNPK